MTTESELLDKIYETSIDAAIEASSLVLKYWPNLLNPRFDKHHVLEIFKKQNGVGNYATVADIESENIIIQMIQGEPLLKNHSIIAEETGGKKAKSEYQWIIDPIDGTQNFRNGLSDFGISIGVIYRNAVITGIIAMPALGKILAAKKGYGTKLFSLEKEELLDLTEISYSNSLDTALIGYDLGYENRVDQMKKGPEKIADKVGYPAAYASVCAAHYRLAMAQIGGYFHLNPTKYDIAAATIIVSELGGFVTDIKGNTIDWSSPNVTYLGARSRLLHMQLLDLLNN